MSEYGSWQQFRRRIIDEGDRLKTRIELPGGAFVGEAEQLAFSESLITQAGGDYTPLEVVPFERLHETAGEVAKRRDAQKRS